LEPSARSIAASNRALWGGFLIAAGGRRVLFAADSGYGPHFREIAARLGPVDLALLGTFPLTPEGIDEPVREHLYGVAAMAYAEEKLDEHDLQALVLADRKLIHDAKRSEPLAFDLARHLQIQRKLCLPHFSHKFPTVLRESA